MDQTNVQRSHSLREEGWCIRIVKGRRAEVVNKDEVETKVSRFLPVQFFRYDEGDSKHFFTAQTLR